MMQLISQTNTTEDDINYRHVIPECH